MQIYCYKLCSITSTISDECKYKNLLLAFTNDPKPGERNGGALALADNITSFVVKNPQNLTNAALAKYRYIAFITVPPNLYEL